MEKDNDKFCKPNWDNALTDWRDYPYDIGSLPNQFKNEVDELDAPGVQNPAK